MPITFEQVTYGYDGPDAGTRALDGVSLTIADGEFVGVIGHTGSGKSTLAELACAARLPDAGRVVVDGAPTADRRGRREARRRVGYVMQYPERQLFAETVGEDVAFGPRNLGASRDEARAAAREALGLVGLSPDDLIDASPFDLSGGQRRRVALAGVLAMRPRAIVADEPTAGLDPQARQGVLDILRSLHGRGVTVVMVSHDMDHVAALAQHLVALAHGRVIADGTPAEVFSRAEELRRAGLDVPTAARVARDLAARGYAFAGEVPLTLDALARAVAAQAGPSAPRASAASPKSGPESESGPTPELEPGSGSGGGR